MDLAAVWSCAGTMSCPLTQQPAVQGRPACFAEACQSAPGLQDVRLSYQLQDRTVQLPTEASQQPHSSPGLQLVPVILVVSEVITWLLMQTGRKCDSCRMQASCMSRLAWNTAWLDTPYRC